MTKLIRVDLRIHVRVFTLRIKQPRNPLRGCGVRHRGYCDLVMMQFYPIIIGLSLKHFR